MNHLATPPEQLEERLGEFERRIEAVAERLRMLEALASRGMHTDPQEAALESTRRILDVGHRLEKAEALLEGLDRRTAAIEILEREELP